MKFKTLNNIILLFIAVVCFLPSCSDEATGPVNLPPTIPENPTPSHGGSSSIDVILQWASTDPDGDPLVYDVYFGESSPPPQAVINQDSSLYDPGLLTPGNTYYWRIVAKDNNEHQTSGPVWTFSATDNQAPDVPFNPTPQNNSLDQAPVNLELTWNATDLENDPLTYDVYVDTQNPPQQLIAEDITSASVMMPSLEREAIHYWYVVARDTSSNETVGPVWQFATSPPIELNLFSSTNLAGNSTSIKLANNIAYMSAYSSFVIYDISNPNNPFLLAVLPPDYPISGPIQNVSDIEGNYAYLKTMGLGGFTAIDISNPNNPSYYTEVDLPAYSNSQNFMVDGNYCYLVFKYGSYTYTFVIYDLSTYTEVFWEETEEEKLYNICVDQGYAYVTGGPLKIYDIHNPENPILTGKSLNGQSTGGPIVVSPNGYAFCSANEGMEIYDVNTPANPILVGFFPFSDPLYDRAYDLACNESYVFLAGASDGLLVVDVIEKSKPKFAGYYDNYTNGIVLQNGLAYLTGSSSLTIVDISPFVQ